MAGMREDRAFLVEWMRKAGGSDGLVREKAAGIVIDEMMQAGADCRKRSKQIIKNQKRA
jgi:hypothetical protein